MIKFLVILILSMTSGCGSIDAYRSVAADRGADASDQSYETGIWLTCNGASVGALMRRYPTREEQVSVLDKCDSEASR